ncbi:MAG TPA: efflux RND transporter periplasmic adaptor subunit, partial [Ktedonobacteraceae bacterium]|nr:efflux RND transporter periplasmic adaptor subunit [Ktedonobacteraceae bacterium]
FITIADTSTLQVLASVNESDTANLKVGETAQFTVSAYGNRIFSGIVSAISPLGQTVSNVVTFPVTIDVNKDDLQNATLLPGMTASVTIVVVQQPNVTLVPVNAINFARTAVTTVNDIPPLITTQQAVTALAQARQQLTNLLNQNPSLQQQSPIPAYVIEQPNQSTFIAVPVVLGLTDDTNYVVLQGISPGDIVVVGATRG